MNKKLLKYILSQDWYRKNFEATAFADYQWQALLPYQKKNKFFKVRLKEAIIIASNFQVNWFWNQKDLKRVRDWLVAEIKNDSLFSRKLVHKWELRLKTYLKLLEKVRSLDLAKLPDPELLENFHSLYDFYLKTITVSVIIEGFSLNAEKWLGGEFQQFLAKKKMAEKSREYFSLLTQTTRPSFVQEAAIAKKSGMNPKNLAANFYWIHFNYLHIKPLTETFFKSWRPDSTPNFRQIRERKKQLMQKIGLSKELKNIFNAADLFTWLQDQRKKHALLATEWMYEFLFEAGRRKGVAKGLLLRALPPEMGKLLKNSPDYLKQLKKRIDPVLVYVNDKGQTFVSAGKIGAIVLKKIYSVKHQSELSGAATFLGKIRGKVKIVSSVKDMARFRQGNILVASMTRPEFIPILAKAAAIVTDDGGITSHAAIISREMRKPCIIGTKIATRVFKDGDMVEVDATRGVVRKI